MAAISAAALQAQDANNGHCTYCCCWSSALCSATRSHTPVANGNMLGQYASSA